METTALAGHDRVCFDDFELDLHTGELRRGRFPLALRPLASRCLVALVADAGRLVSREDLQRILWPDAVVAWDQSLNQCIRQVRRTLGDDAAAPRFIETVPRRGYRFKASVVRRTGLPERRPAPRTSGRARSVRLFLMGAATTLAIPVIILLICFVLAGL